MGVIRPRVFLTVQDASQATFRLGQTRLATGRLGRAVTDGFILGTAQLGTWELGGGTAVPRYPKEISDHVTSISVRRGMAPAGAWLTHEAGVATVTISDALDPDTERDIRPGTPVTITYPDAGIWLFTGVIARGSIRWRKQLKNNKWRYTVTFVAYDLVAELARTKLGTVLPAAQMPARLTAAAERANKTIAMSGGALPPIPTCAPLGPDRSVADALTLACATGRSMWWVRANGTLAWRQVPLGWTGAEATYSDTSQPSFYELDASLDTANLVTRVIIRNTIADATGAETTTEYTNSDATLIATYGVQAATVETNATFADTYIPVQNYAPRTMPNTITLDKLTIAGLPTLDIGASITVAAFGKAGVLTRVIAIECEIHPLDTAPDARTTYTLRRI